MKVEDSRYARAGRSVILSTLASILLASCTTSGSDEFMGFSPTAASSLAAAEQTVALRAPELPSADAPAPVSAFVQEEGDPNLPDTVAAAPGLRPVLSADGPVSPLQETTLQQQAEALAAQQQVQQQIVTAALAPQQAAPTAAESQTQTVPVPAPSPAAAAAPAPTAESVPAPRPEAEPPAAATAFIAPTEPPKKRGLFASLFGNQQQQSAPQPLIPQAAAPAPSEAPKAPAAAPEPKPRPVIQLASNGNSKPAKASGAGENALPGVRTNSLFEISRRSGADESDDIDVYEDEEAPVQVASAAGLARLAPNGLLRQTDHVDVACLKPSLVRTLKAIENHFGRKVVVTSGYRNPARNAKARGARNSLHMYCAAADVKVEGVSKAQLAAFARSMPGRGGVGTYCHTDAVHIDVGPERDWNWRCRRRK